MTRVPLLVLSIAGCFDFVGLLLLACAFSIICLVSCCESLQIDEHISILFTKQTPFLMQPFDSIAQAPGSSLDFVTKYKIAQIVCSSERYRGPQAVCVLYVKELVSVAIEVQQPRLLEGILCFHV